MDYTVSEDFTRITEFKYLTKQKDTWMEPDRERPSLLRRRGKMENFLIMAPMKENRDCESTEADGAL